MPKPPTPEEQAAAKRRAYAQTFQQHIARVCSRAETVLHREERRKAEESGILPVIKPAWWDSAGEEPAPQRR